MNLCNQISEALNVVQSVELDGKKYSIDIQKAIESLIQYEFDNPDMGNFDDFKDDKERLKSITKGLKKLDVTTVKEQIELLVGEDEISLKQLLKDKVIR